MKSRQGTVIALIDLSASFDTIDHDILLARLQQQYGIDGVTLRWMWSYLSERTQSVVINRVLSNDTTLISGVPQGSVLGPILFSLYVQPIGDIIRKHELKYHQYTDDLQLFCHFPLDPLSLSTAVRRIEQCIDELQDWMTANYLQMNDSKSEILPVIPRHKTDMTQGPRVCVGSDYVTVVRHFKNLGVYLDRHLDMSTQVSRTCSLHMRNIAQILRYLTRPTTERVVNALITSRLDYCNPLLFGRSTDSNDCKTPLLNKSLIKVVVIAQCHYSVNYSGCPSVIVCHTRSLSWHSKRSTLICLLLIYSSACRCIHLPGIFVPRAPTLLCRTDPTLQLATALSWTWLPQFGMRYLSPSHPKTRCYHSK